MAQPNIELEQDDKVEASINKVDKVILYGPGGVGKSFAVASSLIDAPNRRLVYLMTEKNAAGGLERGLKHYGIKVEEGQIIYVYPKDKKPAYSNLLRALGTYQNETKVDALKGKATTTENKSEYTFLTDIIKLMNSFTGVDYLTGNPVKIGNIGVLDKDDILVIDGLSPIGHSLWKTMCGDKLAIGQNDYLPVQTVMYEILAGLSNIDCPVILLAHEKVHTDDKGTHIATTVNTCVGNANYQTLMGLFTDVIHATKEGSNRYKWELNIPKIHTISRRIPDNEKNLEPNFHKYNFFT